MSHLVLSLVFSLIAAPFASAQDDTPVRKGAPLTILQINDVYETLPVNGVGGLARVATLKRNLAAAGSTPVVVLAGDFLSSSVASSIFKGAQMIDAFNAMGLDFATLGNHEFDFGKDVLVERMAASKFTYVVANVLDDQTGKPVGGAERYVVRTFNGLRVAFFGLCLTDEEISQDRRRGLRFLDPIESAGGVLEAIRAERVDAVVAITHLSYAQDRALARRFPQISVIAGGHEHYPITSFVGDTLISKAGSDAKFVARIDLRRDGDGLERHFSLVPIDASLKDDPETAAVAARYESKLTAELEVVVGSSAVPLDAESRHIRTNETNLGNLVADALRADASADVAIINSGSIRGDRVYPAGPLTRRTIIAMQPFGNVVCKLEVPGQVIVDALNHAVSKLPASAGQFPQVSGLTMKVDPSAPAGNRVRDVAVGGRPLDIRKTYTLSIPDYILNGGDGYAMFAGQRVVVGPEAGGLIVSAIEKYVGQKKTVAPEIEKRIEIK